MNEEKENIKKINDLEQTLLDEISKTNTTYEEMVLIFERLKIDVLINLLKTNENKGEKQWQNIISPDTNYIYYFLKNKKKK